MCDTYSTDDLTQLLEHYKLLHDVELSVSDSSILLTAAIAAFQTGHTIEMTGAILNTISTITNENGITIINGEEIPVHTTVQYKCTLCYEIFYEKLFIVQHLHDVHQFDVDVSYFEAIEVQQQEQLQQKLFEQEQEQLQLVAAQQQQQQQAQQTQEQQFVPQGATTAVIGQAQGATSIVLNQKQQDEHDAMLHLADMQQHQLAATGTVNHYIDTSSAAVMQIQEQAQQQPQSATSTQAALAAAASNGHIVYKCDTCDHRDTSYESLKKHEKTHLAQMRFICLYCYFGADKMKKIYDHVKRHHTNKEFVCMDNMKNEKCKVFDEQLQQQQQQQQLLQQSLQQSLTATPPAQPTYLDTSSNLLNLTPTTTTTTSATGPRSATKRRNTSVDKKHTHAPAPVTPTHTQIQTPQHVAQPQIQQPVVQPQIQHPQQQQQPMQQPQQQPPPIQQQPQVKSDEQQSIQQHILSGGIEPQVTGDVVSLFLDNNNQVLIDFNENDDLQCAYCDLIISNFNFMRTHIKFKHREKKVTFRNRKNFKTYTIANDDAILFEPQKKSSQSQSAASSTSAGTTNDAGQTTQVTKSKLAEQNINEQTTTTTTTTTTANTNQAQSTNDALTTTSGNQFVLNEENMKMYSHLNITLNCHYCWAQFQLNASRNPKENGNNKFMQHLNLHLNAPYLCSECSYPVRDLKTFLKHKEFYKHDETAVIAKTNKCEMIENKIYKYLTFNKNSQLLLNQQQQPQTIAQQQPTANDSIDLIYKYKCSMCNMGSNDKEDLLKHILIVHLAFLAYKCDLCTYYAFDEMQIRAHGSQIHKLSECKSKIIKTEEEINLALNKANQILVVNENINSSVSVGKGGGGGNNLQQSQHDQQLAQLCDALPRYKCCKCAADQQQQQQQQPMILNSYQESLEHIIKVHLNSGSQIAGQKGTQQYLLNQQLLRDNTNKKVCYELELLEENLDKLKDKVTLPPSNTTTTLSSTTLSNSTNSLTTTHSNKRKHDQLDDSLDEDYYINANWNTITSEKTHKRFTYKSYLIFKCKLCSRKFNYFNIDHWLHCHNTCTSITYQCIKCQQNRQTSILHTTTTTTAKDQQTPNDSQSTTTTQPTTNNHHHSIKEYKNLYEFYFHYKNQHYIKEQNADLLVSYCFICSNEVKSINYNQHLQSQHSINLNENYFNDFDLQLIQIMQTYSLIDVYQGVRVRTDDGLIITNQQLNQSCISANEFQLQSNRKDLYTNEVQKLNEIHQQQVKDKSILSWLNIDQLLIRNFNYNSYVCSICGLSKDKIIKSYSITNNNNNSNHHNNHHNSNNINHNSDTSKSYCCTSTLANDTDDVILIVANHILAHFNEYCYRCIACKISWPDRTQLLKHSQECPNSQVVRTKTKYKLKANSRINLQYNLLTYLNYWSNELQICNDSSSSSCLLNSTTTTTSSPSSLTTSNTTTAINQKKIKTNSVICLQDLFKNENKLLLFESCNSNLNAINLPDGKRILFEDDIDDEDYIDDLM